MDKSLNSIQAGPKGATGAESVVTGVDANAFSLFFGTLSGNNPPVEIGPKFLRLCIPGVDGVTSIGSTEVTVNQFGHVVGASDWNG